MAEALKYITELSQTKFKIEQYAVVVLPLAESNTELFTRIFKVPPGFISSLAAGQTTTPDGRARPAAIDMLKSNGIQFPEGATASFVPATSSLIVRNTQVVLDQMETAVELMWKKYQEDNPIVAKSKSGVLPVKLELPATGRVFEFRGHEKPESLTLRYFSWERQMTKACFWLLAGLVGFYCCGRKRPCWRTFLVALVLTCVPLALLPTWLPMANALLTGWFIGLGVWLLRCLARWVERTGNREQAAGRVLA
jgi:hypothetical protein